MNACLLFVKWNYFRRYSLLLCCYFFRLSLFFNHYFFLITRERACACIPLFIAAAAAEAQRTLFHFCSAFYKPTKHLVIYFRIKIGICCLMTAHISPLCAVIWLWMSDERIEENVVYLHALFLLVLCLSIFTVVFFVDCCCWLLVSSSGGKLIFFVVLFLLFLHAFDVYVNDKTADFWELILRRFVVLFIYLFCLHFGLICISCWMTQTVLRCMCVVIFHTGVVVIIFVVVVIAIT